MVGQSAFREKGNTFRNTVSRSVNDEAMIHSSGSTTILSAYAFLLLWGLVIARNAKDGFGAMLALGVVGLLFWPAMLNVGMVLGVAPVIGVPLPLISYGGSALVTTLIAIGFLMNVSLRRWVF